MVILESSTWSLMIDQIWGMNIESICCYNIWHINLNWSIPKFLCYHFLLVVVSNGALVMQKVLLLASKISLTLGWGLNGRCYHFFLSKKKRRKKKKGYCVWYDGTAITTVLTHSVEDWGGICITNVIRSKAPPILLCSFIDNSRCGI